MKVSSKNFWFALIFGLMLGGAFTISAFSEPTSSPSSSVNYPPVNVGAETQIREGSLGLGNGTTQASSTLTNANSLYVSGQLAADAVNVRKNATLVGNVTVNGGRSIVAGALRAGQVVVGSSTSSVPSYNSTGEKLFFPNGTTTNLIRGNTCTISSNATCPPGTVLATYNTNGTGTCRFINPVYGNPGSNGACSTSGYPTVSISLTSTSNGNNCKSTRYYSTNSSGTVYWQLKGINDTEWTSFGSGSTTQVVVGRGGSSTKLYDLRATVVQNGATAIDTEEVFSVVDTSCTSQTGGTGAGATGQ